MERLRIIVLLFFFSLGALLIVGRLFQLQIIEGEDWLAEAETLASREQTIPFRRGSILDRNGRVIAYDEMTYSIDFEYKSFRLKNPVGQAAHALWILHGDAGGTSGLPTLSKIAEASQGAARLLSEVTFRQMAEITPEGDREAFKTYIERLVDADRATRTRLREAMRARATTRLHTLIPNAAEMIAARLGDATGSLHKLDDLLGLPRGGTLQKIDEVRSDMAADVEAGLARSFESGAITHTQEVSSERSRRQRRREAWLERFLDDIPYEAVEYLQFRIAKFPGFTTVRSTARRYAASTLPWVVGSVRRQTGEELAAVREAETRLEDLLRQLERSAADELEIEWLRTIAARNPPAPGDLIGGDGIERAFELQLRGTRGAVFEVYGRRGGAEDRVEVTPPRHGSNIQMTIDLNLQHEAGELIRAGVPSMPGVPVRGAVAVMDIWTGDVLAVAAAPDFTREDLRDRDTFARLLSIDNDKNNPAHPLHHRGYRPWLPPTPGSSFKIVTALAGLESGLVTAETRHRCEGKVGNLKCDGVHLDVAMREAIEQSCNCYFGWLGERLGIERLAAAARRFGYEQKTGFDPLEVRGGFGIERADVDMLRRCGVGYQMDCTPLQVARSFAAVANGGKVMKLRTVRSVDGKELPTVVESELNTRPEYLQLIQDGLRDVVEGARGTARQSGLSSYYVAGKTGTAEVDPVRNLNHAWFAGYAPLGRPRIAFAVYLERVPLHGKDVTPIVRALLGSDAMKPYLIK